MVYFISQLLGKKPTTLSEFTPEVLERIREILASHNYEMIERIGVGGFSIIFKVNSLKYNKFFAAKVTNMESKRHKTSSLAAQMEQNALQHLNHPNIIKLYESFNESGLAFLILELCTGDSVRKMIVEHKNRPLSMVVDLMKQIADALLYCHNNHFVHRDIKPANILFDQYHRPILADFGMCIQIEPGQTLNDYAGSPQYISPEILTEYEFDPYKSDVWSLGVTFYEMATEMIKWPKEKDLIRATITEGGIFIRPETNPAIAYICRAMTEMNPNKRPPMDIIANCRLFNRPLPPMTKYLTGSQARINVPSGPSSLKKIPRERKNSLSNAQKSLILDHKHLGLASNRQISTPNMRYRMAKTDTTDTD